MSKANTRLRRSLGEQRDYFRAPQVPTLTQRVSKRVPFRTPNRRLRMCSHITFLTLTCHFKHLATEKSTRTPAVQSEHLISLQKNNQANLTASPPCICSHRPAACLFVPDLPRDLTCPCPANPANKSPTCCGRALCLRGRPRGGGFVMPRRKSLYPSFVNPDQAPCTGPGTQPPPLCPHILLTHVFS